MRTFRQILFGFIVMLTVVGTIMYLYQTYHQDVISYLFGEQKVAISIRNVSVVVTVVDTPETRLQGLSGVASLPEKEGMLFVFDKEGDYSFWMKDTLIPLDIIWINDDFKVVHIEQNVRPESYPLIYSSPYPARFVLEVNAFFVPTFDIVVGDTVQIPGNRIPMDLRE